jgi:tripartite-type tricarboxylate transporter receptor subunit TctC
MTRTEKSLRLIGGALCALSSMALAADAPYPSKPIRFIIPFAPGGGNDIVGRMLGAKLGEAWGQQVVIDNRPGAGGNIAAETTARAAPDGYTVFQFNIANTMAPSLYKKLGYDPQRDFAPVTQIGSTPFILVVHPSAPAKTVPELIAYMKAQPGKLNYASSGNGGSTHLVTELFKYMAGVSMTHIPYSGAGPAITELIGGQVQLMFVVPAAGLPNIRNGRLRALGMSSAKRSSLAPDLPTLAESGVPGFEGGAWYGVVVAAKTPLAIVHKLNTDIVKALHLPDVRERMTAQGVEVVASSAEDFAKFIKAEIAKWSRVVALSGARAE